MIPQSLGFALRSLRNVHAWSAIVSSCDSSRAAAHAGGAAGQRPSTVEPSMRVTHTSVLLERTTSFTTGVETMKVYALMSTGILALAIFTSLSVAGSPSVEPAQVAAAKTANDHEAIAKEYEAEAAELDRKVEMHEQMLATYKSNGKLPGPAKHCAALVKDLKAAAQEDRNLAAEHHKLAEAAGK